MPYHWQLAYFAKVRKKILILGATGSIGQQSISVLKSMQEYFEVVGLSANSNLVNLLNAAAQFSNLKLCLSGMTSSDSRIQYQGSSGLERMIRESDAEIVINGISGSAGLRPSLIVVEEGKRLALANKESVVMAWRVLSACATERNVKIIPVDSEHAGLFQLINRIGKDEIEELIITASGGAFRDTPLSELNSVTPDAATTHPNWKMGRKISIDSATMANKGLEIIEAALLFDFPMERVKVLIHPQSLVHALVRTKDGLLYAQISEPDMRLPIKNALTWPQIEGIELGHLDLAGKRLDFYSPDPKRYPMLGIAYEALLKGEGSTIAFNAANEIAVSAFENYTISFLDISIAVSRVVDFDWPSQMPNLESIFETDRVARQLTADIIREME